MKKFPQEVPIEPPRIEPRRLLPDPWCSLFNLDDTIPSSGPKVITLEVIPSLVRQLQSVAYCVHMALYTEDAKDMVSQVQPAVCLLDEQLRALSAVLDLCHRSSRHGYGEASQGKVGSGDEEE